MAGDGPDPVIRSRADAALFLAPFALGAIVLVVAAWLLLRGAGNSSGWSVVGPPMLVCFGLQFASLARFGPRAPKGERPADRRHRFRIAVDLLLETAS